MIENLDKYFAAALAKQFIREFGFEPPSIIKAGLYPSLMFRNLRGGNDNLKFEQIFSEAPAWLLKFTAIEWDAKLLGFELRKLIGTPALGRDARLDRNKWGIRCNADTVSSARRTAIR
jgi:hypothetical protein